MWKAKVKDQLLACTITFMWTLSEHTGKTERMKLVAKKGLRSDLRVYNLQNISWRECATVSLAADACYVRTECAHAVPA